MIKKQNPYKNIFSKGRRAFLNAFHKIFPLRLLQKSLTPSFRVALRLPGMTIFYYFQEFCKSLI